DVVGAQGADCVANRQTAGQNGQLHVAARGGDAAGGHGGGAVGHGADREGVGVGVGDRAVVVGGQRGHVVAAVIERDRAAAQELQAGGRDHVVGRLRHRAAHVQCKLGIAERDVVVAQRADCVANGQTAGQDGQLDVVVRGRDPAGGHGGGAVGYSAAAEAVSFTLSLHDALPICQRGHVVAAVIERDRAGAQELQAGGRDHVVGR